MGSPTTDRVDPVVKLVQVRPGRKLWEVRVSGPTVMSPWMPSAIQVQTRSRVPPQLYVAVAFEWPGYSLAFGTSTKDSQWLTNLRTEAEATHVERLETGDDGDESWEVAMPCDVCEGVGWPACSRCDGTGKTGPAKDICSSCDGDGDSECHECGGEGHWFVDYEPGLEHWPGITAAWAAEAGSGQ